MRPSDELLNAIVQGKVMTMDYELLVAMAKELLFYRYEELEWEDD